MGGSDFRISEPEFHPAKMLGGKETRSHVDTSRSSFIESIRMVKACLPSFSMTQGKSSIHRSLGCARIPSAGLSLRIKRPAHNPSFLEIIVGLEIDRLTSIHLTETAESGLSYLDDNRAIHISIGDG
jgi:hypothetical protein